MAVKNYRDMVNVEATMDKIARWEQLIPDFHMDWVNEANMAQEFNVELYREAMVEDEGDGFSLPAKSWSASSTSTFLGPPRTSYTWIGRIPVTGWSRNGSASPTRTRRACGRPVQWSYMCSRRTFLTTTGDQER